MHKYNIYRIKSPQIYNLQNNVLMPNIQQEIELTEVWYKSNLLSLTSYHLNKLLLPFEPTPAT
jgi:hypothetical protein